MKSTFLLSSDFYDELSIKYDEVLRSKQPYIDAINRAILAEIRGLNLNYQDKVIADFGCGNAVRTLYFANVLKPKRVFLIDNSANQLEKSVDIACGEKIKGDIENVLLEEGFDYGFCLWNVLGHLGSEIKASEFLKNAAKQMNIGGLLFVDVNNRYNMRAYGMANGFKNMAKDALSAEWANGDFSFSYTLEDRNIITKTHVFTIFEMIRIIRSSGLKVKRILFIDYKNGSKRRSFLTGQPLFILTL